MYEIKSRWNIYILAVIHSIFPGFASWEDLILINFQNRFCARSAQPRQKFKSVSLLNIGVGGSVELGEAQQEWVWFYVFSWLFLFSSTAMAAKKNALQCRHCGNSRRVSKRWGSKAGIDFDNTHAWTYTRTDRDRYIYR